MKRPMIFCICFLMATVSLFAMGTQGRGTPEAPPVVRSAEDTDDYRMAEPVSLTFALQVNDVQNVFDKFSVSDNPALDMIKEYVNVQMVNKFTLPQEGFQQQINLGIASGDLPNVFAVDAATAAELIRNELLVDMRPYIEQWATPALRSIYEVDNGVNYLPVTRGDKIYGLPIVTDALNSRFVLWIRDDWMINLGLNPETDMPKTMEQLFSLARRFVNEDPNRSGSRDTYGIAMSNELQYGNMSINAFLAAWGGYPGVYSMDNQDNFSYLGVSPGMRDALITLNGLYNEGIFRRDFVTLNMQQAYDDVKAGRVGIVVSSYFAPMASFQEVWAETGTSVSGAPVPPLAGREYHYYAPLSSASYYVVTKGTANPEAIIKIFNNMTHPSGQHIWHREGWPKYVTKLAESGSNAQLNTMMPVQQHVTDVNYNRAKMYIQAFADTSLHSDPALRDILGVGQFPNRVYPAYRYMNIPGFYADPANRRDGASSDRYPEDRNDPRRLQHKINWGVYMAIVEGSVIATEGYTAEPVRNNWYYANTPEMQRFGSILERKEEEMIFGVITGRMNIREWDDYLNNWYPRNGGTQVLESMKAYVQAQRAQ